MIFYKGQKVVCIADEYDGYSKRSNKRIKYNFKHKLTVKEVYTVRGIAYPQNPNNSPILLLEEIVHPRKPDCGFPADCFRPVKEIKTDISIFKEMLNTKQMENVL